MNGWISNIDNGQIVSPTGLAVFQISAFGGDGTNYLFVAAQGLFTLGMNVTFDPNTPVDSYLPLESFSVVWDGTYSKPGANGIFCGAPI